MFKLITFDIYSASLDINGSAVPVVREVLGWSVEKCLDFFKTWRTQQWNFLLLNNSMSEGFMSYRDITAKTLDYAAKKFVPGQIVIRTLCWIHSMNRITI